MTNQGVMQPSSCLGCMLLVSALSPRQPFWAHLGSWSTSLTGLCAVYGVLCISMPILRTNVSALHSLVLVRPLREPFIDRSKPFY